MIEGEASMSPNPISRPAGPAFSDAGRRPAPDAVRPVRAAGADTGAEPRDEYRPGEPLELQLSPEMLRKLVEPKEPRQGAPAARPEVAQVLHPRAPARPRPDEVESQVRRVLSLLSEQAPEAHAGADRRSNTEEHHVD
jgi:hypothetical protein